MSLDIHLSSPLTCPRASCHGSRPTPSAEKTYCCPAFEQPSGSPPITHFKRPSCAISIPHRKPAHFLADNPLVPDVNGEVELLLNKHEEAIVAHPSLQVLSCDNKPVHVCAPLGTPTAITPASLFTQPMASLHFTSALSAGHNQFQPAFAASAPGFNWIPAQALVPALFLEF